MGTTYKDSDLESFVISKLIDAGYPQDAITTDWQSKSSRIDIVVLDVETKIPLMIIECKSSIGQYNYDSLVNRLRKCSNSFDCPVRTFVAFDGREDIEFYDFTDDVNSSSQLTSDFKPVPIPNYDSLRIGIESKYINAQKKKRKKYINGLKIVCWLIIPPLVFVFFILDAKSVYPLTTERLILFGGLLLSILLPFFGEIKVGDITLSNKKKNKD